MYRGRVWPRFQRTVKPTDEQHMYVVRLWLSFTPVTVLFPWVPSYRLTELELLLHAVGYKGFCRETVLAACVTVLRLFDFFQARKVALTDWFEFHRMWTQSFNWQVTLMRNQTAEPFSSAISFEGARFFVVPFRSCPCSGRVIMLIDWSCDSHLGGK